ncbi:unnamed protein product [Camellia sinensis]
MTGKNLEGGIPLPILSEWWLAKEKFSTIEAFIISSFPGATCQGCNGLSIKYQVYVQILQCQNMSTGHLKHLFLSKLLFLQGKRLKRDAGIKTSSHQVIQSLWMHLIFPG